MKEPPGLSAALWASSSDTLNFPSCTLFLSSLSQLVHPVRPRVDLEEPGAVRETLARPEDRRFWRGRSRRRRRRVGRRTAGAAGKKPRCKDVSNVQRAVRRTSSNPRSCFYKSIDKDSDPFVFDWFCSRCLIFRNKSSAQCKRMSSVQKVSERFKALIVRGNMRRVPSATCVLLHIYVSFD